MDRELTPDNVDAIDNINLGIGRARGLLLALCANRSFECLQPDDLANTLDLALDLLLTCQDNVKHLR